MIVHITPRDSYDAMRFAVQVYAIGNPFGLDHTLTQVGPHNTPEKSAPQTYTPMHVS